MRTRSTLVAVAACLLLGSATVLPAAAEAPPAPDDGVAVSDAMATRYLGFAASEGAPAGGGDSIDSTLEGACHRGDYQDAFGDIPGKLDIRAYAVGYECSLRQWGMVGAFPAPITTAAIDGMVLGVDRDRNSATGCEGADTVAAVTRVSGIFEGVTFATPGCAESTWIVTGSAALLFDGSQAGGLILPASAIAHDQEFRWALVAVGTDGWSDRAPSTGWRDMRLPCGVGSTTFTKVTARTVSGVYDDMVGGDFDADGVDDLFFYGRGTAPDGLLQGSGSGLLPVSYRPPVNLSYDGIVSGDYDGDGADDVFFYGAGARQDGYLLATPGSFLLTPVPNSVQVTRSYDGLVSGDFNGDGLDDVFFYGAGSRADGLLKGTANGLRAVSGSTQVSRSYDAIAAGDFDGDGFDDVAFYGRGTAPEGLLRGSAGWLIPTTPGAANGVYDQMRPGDFDGDGFDDLFFYQPGTSCEGLLRGRNSGPMIGVPTPGVDGTYDDFEGGDFDGDGDDDLFFYGRGSKGEGQLLGR